MVKINDDITDLKMREIWKREELQAHFDARKSFYKKAIVLYFRNGDIALLSYSTIVCVLRENGEVLLQKYSQTTNRHIKEFMKQFNIDMNLYK